MSTDKGADKGADTGADEGAIELFCRTTAATIGLNIDEAWLPGVVEYVGLLLSRAALVDGSSLHDELEPAPVFAVSDDRYDNADETLSATTIAANVRGGAMSAVEVTQRTLDGIARHDGPINSFSEVFGPRALRTAAAIDAALAAGRDPGPLAGVPFAVKNLFDVEGVATLAGSAINRDRSPAARDATLIERLERRGAVLVGGLHMDEYAYGFTTENSHYGPTHNPHDLARIAGGSSGGSGAAAAAGLVPITLGSDTNGSIRVPSSLCGVFGLKPTYGRLTRRGAYLFAASLDHLGPLATNVDDLALAYDAMQGPDPSDPACATRDAEPAWPLLHEGIGGLRIARLGGYFEQGAEPEALAALDHVANALGAHEVVEIRDAERARAAAMVITAVEGAQLHEADLRNRAGDFDPMTRAIDFLAGLLIPGSHYVAAQRFRAAYRAEVAALMRRWDVLLAPATPTTAKLIGEEFVTIAGERLRAAPHQGRFTQPISFIGLPVTVVPVYEVASMPIGVQLIGRPFDELATLRVAAQLESLGAVRWRRPASVST